MNKEPCIFDANGKFQLQFVLISFWNYYYNYLYFIISYLWAGGVIVHRDTLRHNGR